MAPNDALEAHILTFFDDSVLGLQNGDELDYQEMKG